MMTKYHGEEHKAALAAGWKTHSVLGDGNAVLVRDRDKAWLASYRLSDGRDHNQTVIGPSHGIAWARASANRPPGSTLLDCVPERDTADTGKWRLL